MSGVAVAVWPLRRQLVAVAADDDGRAQLLATFDRTDEGRWEMLARADAELGLDYELVLPDWLARSDTLAQLALSRGTTVWLIPGPLIEAVRIIGGLGTGPPRRTAAALARVPRAHALRAYLRRLVPDDSRQLRMF
jgi:hypothetical protein